ncbi:MAG: hypothetical protein SYC29_06060 [Planctomycetota bacterium]|nr:hypothetical protein [Planctomycetota bacterium]
MTAIDTSAAAPGRDGDGTLCEERVSTVNADRLCTTCSYNLTGQMVLREPHYGLLIVRCPECGTVAGVQEYPLLGRWANRWGAVLAALYFIVLLGLWPASGAAIMGMAFGTAEEAAHPYGRYLNALHQAATQAGQQPQGTATPPAPPTPPAAPGAIDPQVITRIVSGPAIGDDFEDWWAQQDAQALFAQAGGWREAVDWRVLFLWIPAALTAFVTGWFWSIALLQFRRRWTYAWGAMIMLLALLFGIGPCAEWLWGEVWYARMAARQQISPAIFLATIIICIPPLLAGLAAGRPLTRGLVRALLPPGLRSSLALLWTAEGLPPPRGRAARA